MGPYDRVTVVRIQLNVHSVVESTPDRPESTPSELKRLVLEAVEQAQFGSGNMPEGRLLRADGLDVAIEYVYPPA